MDIIIECHGGLGDQICSEPTFRFITNRWPEYKLHVVTHYPEFFSHLNLYATNQALTLNTSCLKANTHPKEDKLIDFQQIHTVDYISLRLLKMQLPLLEKGIQIKVPESTQKWAIKNIPEDAVVLHPGQSWKSKTFPTEIWQSYIDRLVKADYRVVVVGKNYWANPRELRGTVTNLDLSKCIDMVDQLSVMELASVLQRAPVLISNDSGPAHISAAFNNHVGIISTIRRPETLFHWRNGIQGFRYYSLEKYRIYDQFIPNTIRGDMTYNLNEIPQVELLRALPSDEDILQFVKRVSS